MGNTALLEGESEEKMILWFHRRCRPTTQLYSNFQAFRESEADHKLLILTCSGCDDILPTADEYKFLIKEGHHGVIVRDLEENSCFSNSKVLAQIQLVCNEYLLQPHKGVLLSKPYFEVVYAADMDLFRRTLTAQVTEQGGDSTRLPPLVDTLDWTRPGFKSLFSKLGLAYKKPAFADRFFSQFDFENSTAPYFIRLRTIFP